MKKFIDIHTGNRTTIINLDHVMYIKDEALDGNDTVIYFADGTSVQSKMSVKDIWDKIKQLQNDSRS